MSHLAIRYRPKRLDQVVGQTNTTLVLKHAVMQQKLPPALLLCGMRGIGKTSLARIVARSYNCKSGPSLTPCGECVPCQDVLQQLGTDYVEIDGASHNGVEAIRSLCDNTLYAPQHGRCKFYVIDEVHMLTMAAFNALLKTLEEPPAHVRFILATTEQHKIPRTIGSRCMTLHLRPVGQRVLSEYLQQVAQQEQFSLDQTAAWTLAELAEGSVRDALSLLEHVRHIASAPHRLTRDDVATALELPNTQQSSALVRLILKQQAKALVAALQQLEQSGIDPERMLMHMAYRVRDLLIYRVAPCVEPCRRHPMVQECKDLAEDAELASDLDLQRLFGGLLQLGFEVARLPLKVAHFEMGLLRLAQATQLQDLHNLLDKLESKLTALPELTDQPSIPAMPAAEGRASAPAVPAAVTASAPVVLPPSPVTPSTEDFSGLVEFVRERQPALASMLQNAQILLQTPNQLTLCFAAHSFYQETLSDPEMLALCRGYCQRYWNNPQFKLNITTPPPGVNLAASLANHQKQQDEQARLALYQQAKDHPWVQALVRGLQATLEKVEPCP